MCRYMYPLYKQPPCQLIICCISWYYAYKVKDSTGWGFQCFWSDISGSEVYFFWWLTMKLSPIIMQNSKVSVIDMFTGIWTRLLQNFNLINTIISKLLFPFFCIYITKLAQYFILSFVLCCYHCSICLKASSH